MGYRNSRMAVFLTAILISSGFLFIPAPAAAEGWVKVDMGAPSSPPRSLLGVAVGDGDRDNRTEVYFVPNNMQHLYIFRLVDGRWTTEDIGEWIPNSSWDLLSSGVIIGDADDDGLNELYAVANDFYSSISDKQFRICQLANESGIWSRTEIGGTIYLIYDFCIGDGNRDGRKELYAACGDGHIYEFSKAGGEWNRQDIGASPTRSYVYNNYTYTGRSIMSGVAVGDGDNDGRTEVYGSAWDGHVYMFSHDSSGWNRTDLGAGKDNEYAPLGSGLTHLVIGDADNNGAREVYAHSNIDNGIWRYDWNSSAEQWENCSLFSLNSSVLVTDLIVGDGDSDGRNEFYIGTDDNMVLQISENPDGSWRNATIGTGNDYISSLAIGSLSDESPMNEVFAACADGHGYEFYNDRIPPPNPKVWSDTHPKTGVWYRSSRVRVLWEDIGFDRSGIDGYSYLWDGNATTVPDDTKDCEEDVHELTTTMADGTWYFHIRAADNAGNWNRTAVTYGPVGIDTTPPDFLSLAINGGDEYTNNGLVTLSVTAADGAHGSGIAQMAFSNDGDWWSDWEPYSPNRSGWDLTNGVFGGNGTDGPKTVRAKVKDAMGLEIAPDKRARDGIFLDRAAPGDLGIVINDGAEWTNSSNVSLALAAKDPDPASGLGNLSLSNDGLQWSGWLDWNGSAGWSLTKGAGGTDSDGNKTVYFRARDRAGNIGGPEKASISLDRRAPGELSILIDSGAEYTNDTDATLTIDGADPDQGSQTSDMTLANSEPALGAWETFSRTRTGWSLTTGAGGTDTDGDKAVYLEFRDRAGNVGGPVKDTIFLDRVRPQAAAILINGGAKYAIDPNVKLLLKASDADPSSGISQMQFSDDGARWSDWEPFSNSRAYTLPAPDGQKTVYFRVRDRAGNVADAASASIILDTAAPVISSVRVVGLTDTSAIITWSTDEEADSGVDFGLSAAYGSSKLDPAFVASHSVPLGGLTPTTAYHFRVQSRDRAGNPPAFSPDYVFITTATPDTTPPSLANVLVEGVTDTLAVVSWTTNEPADSFVEYGTDTGYGLKVSDPGNFVLRHSVTLSKLSPSTTYHLRAASTDPSGNGPSKNEDIMFTTMRTPDTTPPVISNVRVSGITDKLAVVTWETDEPADGAVEYGTTASYGSTATHTGLGTLHELTLLNLKASSTYHFRVKSRDATGNGPSASRDLNFTTAAKPDTEPPSIIALSVEAISASSAIVLWETSEMADAYVEYGPTIGYGHSSTVWEYSLQHSVLLQGLLPDKVYHLRARSADPSGNLATSGDVAFRTGKKTGAPDTTPPVISGASVSGVTDTRAVVLWATDEPADSLVEYGSTAAYGLRASDLAYTLVHSIVLEGLSPSTEYHLQIISTDPSGNGPSRTGDIRFVTGIAPDTRPPGIYNVSITEVTNTSALISWSTDEPASGMVEYGTDLSYGRSRTSGIYAFSHSIRLDGLSPSTTYHFSVTSVDPSSNIAPPTADRSFTTPRTSVTPAPGPKHGKPSNGGFPWAWIGLAALAVAMAAGLIIYRRRTARKGEGAAPDAKDEELETLAMDEPGPQEQTSMASQTPAGRSVPLAPAVAVPAVGAHPPGRMATTPVRQVRCPSCQTRIPIYNDAPQQIRCPVCGMMGPYRPKSGAPAGTPSAFVHSAEPSRNPALDALVSWNEEEPPSRPPRERPGMQRGPGNI
jgi:hypothetical protein